jgi:hypothetical protein
MFSQSQLQEKAIHQKKKDKKAKEAAQLEEDRKQ